MVSLFEHRRQIGGGAALLAIVALLGSSATSRSAGPPAIGATWSSAVFSSTARLHAEIDPNGFSTSYHFAYITKAAHDANLAAGKDGFAGAARTPPVADAPVGSGSGFVAVVRLLSGLAPDTAYHYRAVAKNSAGTSTGPTRTFITFAPATALAGCANDEVRGIQNVKALLPDCRGWEMVSPVDKNGGQVDPAETLAGGGLQQTAATGGLVTYSSAASFGAGAGGAPPASQYIASRGPGGWASANITVPVFSGSYDTAIGGAPYRLFSGDLARGLLLSGKHCRGEASGCPVANPPLAGTDAPAGYQNHYLRDSATGGFEALLGTGDVAGLELDPAELELRFAGSSPDLRHVVLASCAALTANATEVAAGTGCDQAQPNLYRWSAGSLSLVNVLPAQGQGTPGAALGAQSGAVSADGSRVYWRDLVTGNLYLREGLVTKQVDAAAGGGGAFEVASADGSIAFFTKGGHLWRYLVAAGSAADLTPSGGVVGVLGASADGSRLYYQDASGLHLLQAGGTTTVAPGADAADAANYPPATGKARVSADGTKLLFVSTASLTGYDNIDLVTKTPDSQVYLYDAVTAQLSCISCNPSLSRPIGPSSVPGAIANGTAPGSPHVYKPRALSADGRRAFFESDDALVLADTNNDVDVYQWEAQAAGSCTRPGGCVALISSGRATDGARFVDASADGGDAFFLTDESLVSADPGSLDLYDARVDGGFPVPPPPHVCSGDSCQVLPPEPIDPTLGTLIPGPGNPPVSYRKYGRARKTCPQGKRLKTVGRGKDKVKRCVKIRKRRGSGR